MRLGRRPKWIGALDSFKNHGCVLDASGHGTGCIQRDAERQDTVQADSAYGGFQSSQAAV